jgi:predicted  nucleic acid-binding Zn-ribbon protein
MTDFTDLDLTKPVDEMEADEARETLAEFMDSHRDNREAYDELQTEFSQREDELTDEVEELEGRVAEFTEEKAERAAEHVKMPADLLAARFSIDELEQIIEEGEEFSEGPEDEPDDEGPELTSFTEKKQKGRLEDEDRSAQFRDHAKTLLSSQGMHIQEDN